MTTQRLAVLHARSRIAVGAALVALPELAGRAWIGSDASRKPVTIFARALGGRDLVLGLGVVIALDRGAPVRGWLEAGAVADAVDFVATAVARKSIPDAAGRGAMAVAGGSALLCAILAKTLDRPAGTRAVEAPEAALTGHPA